MLDPAHTDRLRKRFLLGLVAVVTLLFVWMIRGFLVTLLMAAIFSSMAHPLHQRLTRWLGDRPRAGSAVTVLLLLVLVAGPVSAFLGIVAGQAVDISQTARPWIEREFSDPGALDDLLSRIPYVDRVIPDRTRVLAKVGEFASSAGRFLANSVVDVTRGTVSFFLQLFILLYAMFYFLLDGRRILEKILYYVPLTADTEYGLAERFVSVTRATLKGSLVIGLIQGALAGVAFWLVGIEGWAFWTTVMVVLSIIPAIGSALVWIPASIYLFATGSFPVAVAFTAWCAAVVGSVDNFLRPKLVGRDTRIPDLLVLIGTLGGISLFGAVGFILGPIVASLFLAVWDLYGDAFKDVLPAAHIPDLGGEERDDGDDDTVPEGAGA